MFGSMPLFSAPLPPNVPPKDVPPATPVNFPHYFPELTGEAPGQAPGPSTTGQQPRKTRLTEVLQGIVRPADVSLKHFEALGVRIQKDADPTAVIPNYYRHVPDFATWDDISYDEARDINESTRKPISNGNKSPGIQTYLDRKRELSIDNNAAYRTVRRLPPMQPGQPPVRLGNAYEFYRHLDSFSSYWDDTSKAPPPAAEGRGSSSASSGDGSAAADAPGKNNGGESSGNKGNDGSNGTDEDGNDSGCDADSVSSVSSNAVTTDSESKSSSPAKGSPSSVPEIMFYRTSAGTQMPPEYRLNMITAFLKLVAYDFGCNVSAPRMEPRLYLNAGSLSIEEAEARDKVHAEAQVQIQKEKEEKKDGQVAAPPSDPSSKSPAKQTLVPAPTSSHPSKGPSSYFSSGCIFIFRSPTTREAARAGIIEGPLAAVSARHTVSFPAVEDLAGLSSKAANKDSSIDLARELVAALLTAQHRAREGRAERRIGKGEWWTTKPRWGGGSGGPIGREVDSAPNTDEVINDNKSEGIVSTVSGSVGGGPPRPGSFTQGSGGSGGRSGSRGNPSGYSGLNTLSGITGMPMPMRGSMAKKPRKGLAIYDNYRMVRPPSSSWDKKTRYKAIGRVPGTDYDDVFVVSALFHHMSIVRVRVPQRLLDALDGEEVEDNAKDAKDAANSADAAKSEAKTDESSLRGLEVVRSPWYDFFKVEDRLAAMRLSWAMMAFLMRKEDGDSGDVQMKDAA